MSDEAVATFQSIAGCDAEFAATFLMAHNGNLEQAVNAFMGDAGVGAFGGSASLPDAAAGMASPGAMASSGPAIPAQTDEERLLERAPMDQYRDTLMDPAQRLPTAPAPPTVHHLEAFRDAKTDAKAEDDSQLDPKHKPKTLADIYRPPTDMCFQGTFDQLRQAGREQGRWLLVNIQSPTEFASQQLNADTWRDETLKMIISASFLFWQQYFDRPEGEKYCRYYLANQPQLPHIGLLDPVTGQLIKSWTGFKDAERLMDKLTEISDTPPTDGYAEEPPPSQPAAAPPIFPHGATSASAPVDDEAELAAAIAASLGSIDDAAPSAPEPEPAWPEPPPEPEAGRADTVTLRVRLPGGNMTRAFLPTHTLNDVLCAVHHSGTMELSMRKTYQLSTMGCAPVTDPATTLQSIGLSGRVMVNLSELP